MTMNMLINNSHLDQDHWGKLGDEVCESILARLPVADLFRSQFVCKRWQSIICSPCFGKALKRLFHRRPWFFMVSSYMFSEVIYDVEVDDWRHIRLPVRVGGLCHPLAASAGLMCCISAFGVLYVCNFLTGSKRKMGLGIMLADVMAISMHSWESFYNVYVVCWKSECLHMCIFSSSTDGWTEFPMKMFRLNDFYSKNLVPLNFFDVQVLSNVFQTNFYPRKELAGVTAVNSCGDRVVYYVEPWGCLVGCNINKKIAVIYPSLPFGSLGLAECNGRVLVPVIMVEDGNEILRVYEFDSEVEELVSIAVLPPEMAKDCSGINSDISCSGCGDYIMVCVSSVQYNFTKSILYNIVEDTWKVLPPCLGPHGHQERFTLGFGFMPNREDNA